jgi:uncharacterized protein YegL
MASKNALGRGNLAPTPRRASANTYDPVRTPYVDPGLVASIQQVFAESRLSHSTWQNRQFYGRFDGRQAHRYVTKGEMDLYRVRRLPSATKLNVHILVDSSGSMGGHNIANAQDCTATLVEAFGGDPNIRVHVWQHNAVGSGTYIYKMYEPGMSSTNLRNMPGRIAGGNADGFALEAIGQKALDTGQPDEVNLVIMVSDGAPSAHGVGARNHDLIAHSQMVTRNLNQQGVLVLSVGIDGAGGVNEQMYGRENNIPFNGDWNDLARTFGTVFGEILRRAEAGAL